MNTDALTTGCAVIAMAGAVLMFAIVPLGRIILQHAPAIVAALN